MGSELLISGITGRVLAYPVMLIFITYHLAFKYHGIYYTHTISNYWPHKTPLYDNKSSHIMTPMTFKIL